MKKLVLVALVMFVLAACGKSEVADRKDWPVETFSFTNQNKETVKLDTLKNKVWVADFVFTSCATVCPPMTANMRKLQKMAEEKNIDLQFVSFSVDPTIDTPEKLKAYGEKFKANEKTWNFLTGYTQADIEAFAQKSFKTVVVKPKKGTQVIHGTDFYLVDKQGKIAKYYQGNKKVPFDAILADAEVLIAE